MMCIIPDYTSQATANSKNGIYKGICKKHQIVIGADKSSYQYRETAKPMPPDSFKNETQKRAYSVAVKYPYILDQIYCHCRCGESLGHKSLLTCYVTKHAAGCGICMAEAILVGDLIKNGKSIDEIADEIDDRFFLLDNDDDEDEDE